MPIEQHHSEKRRHLATALTNWLVDRPLMQMNNTPASIARLLADEMRELDDALQLRKENQPAFDETPGELADVIFFCASLLAASGKDLIKIFETLPTETQDGADYIELEYLTREILFAADQKSSEVLCQNALQFLEAAYVYSYSLGYDPTSETLEKAAYNQTRYLAKNFQLNKADKIAAYLISHPHSPSFVSKMAQKFIEKRFKTVKRAGRVETAQLGLKQTFYETPHATPAIPTEPKKSQRIQNFRKRVTGYAASLANSFIS